MQCNFQATRKRCRWNDILCLPRFVQTDCSALFAFEKFIGYGNAKIGKRGPDRVHISTKCNSGTIWNCQRYVAVAVVATQLDKLTKFHCRCNPVSHHIEFSEETNFYNGVFQRCRKSNQSRKDNPSLPPPEDQQTTGVIRRYCRKRQNFIAAT